MGEYKVFELLIFVILLLFFVQQIGADVVVCGNDATGSVGSVTSPNYPSDYPVNENCNTTITAPEGETIIATFTDFIVEAIGCRYDYIKFYDGDDTSSPLIGTYCGDMTEPDFPAISLPPKNIRSSGRKMSIFFHSDESTQFKGFNLEYKTEKSRKISTNNKEDCDCGISAVGSKRIVGGTDARPHEFPWQVNIRYLNFPNYCGGALVSSRSVVTAAHCLKGLDVKHVKVDVGAHNISEKDGILVSVSEMHPHPGYQKGKNDIAVITLAEDVPLTSISSRPTCLPKPSSTFVGNWGTVAGWGKTNENLPYGAFSPILQKINIPVVTNKVCSAAYNYPMNKYVLCAGLKEGGKDSCQGDSGGPLIAKVEGKRTIIGVVSYGKGCAREGYYGVYTAVSEFLSFIKKHISGTVCTK